MCSPAHSETPASLSLPYIKVAIWPWRNLASIRAVIGSEDRCSSSGARQGICTNIFVAETRFCLLKQAISWSQAASSPGPHLATLALEIYDCWYLPPRGAPSRDIQFYKCKGVCTLQSSQTPGLLKLSWVVCMGNRVNGAVPPRQSVCMTCGNDTKDLLGQST